MQLSVDRFQSRLDSIQLQFLVDLIQQKHLGGIIMILAEKIVTLRKKHGWSQEELADKMDVSRQSISKWESTKSIPDLNKILMLSKIFAVSTDYLVKDEIEDSIEITEDLDTGLRKVTLEDATQYVKNKSESSKMIARGVLLCVCSIVPLLFLLAFADQNSFNITSNTAGAIGFILLFMILAIGVVFIVRATHYNIDIAKFESSRFELEYGVRGIFNEKIKNYKPEYLKRITISIILFLTSCMPLLVVAFLYESSTMALFMVVVLILMIGVGVYIIIPTSILYNALNFIVGEGDYAPHKRKEMRRTEKLAAFYWPLVTAIYIGWSLWSMAWGITWIVWPVAAIGFAALIGFVGIFDSDDEVY